MLLVNNFRYENITPRNRVPKNIDRETSGTMNDASLDRANLQITEPFPRMEKSKKTKRKLSNMGSNDTRILIPVMRQ